MLTFENVLEIFQEYLLRDPEELFDILLSDFQDFAMICRTRGRREVTEADEKAVEELCQPYLDWRKEALK